MFDTFKLLTQFKIEVSQIWNIPLELPPAYVPLYVPWVVYMYFVELDLAWLPNDQK